MEDSVIFYGHFVYFTVKWYILWPFGTIYGHSVYFSHFGMSGKRRTRGFSQWKFLVLCFKMTQKLFHRNDFIQAFGQPLWNYFRIKVPLIDLINLIDF
jgi:hypothetical protein